MKSKSQLKVIYGLTILALIPIFALSGYYIYTSRQNAVKEKIKKLSEIAKSKQVTLENHLGNYIKLLNSVAKNTSLINGLKNDRFDERTYEVVMNFQEAMWGASHHVFVANTEGKIVLSPYHGKNKKSTHFHHSIAGSKYFKGSLEETKVTDFYGFEESTHYHQLVMVPIKDGSKTVGVIISEITIKYFIDLLKEDFELGETGNIYLSTLDKEKVVHLKKDEILPVDSSLIDSALTDGSSFGEANSFNQNVLGSYLKSENYPWILAIEISKEEVLAPINKMTKFITFAYLFFVILFLFVFKYIIKLLKKPVQDISHTIETISSASITNSYKMKQNTAGLVSGSLKLAEALVENQAQLENVIGGIKSDADLIKVALDSSKQAQGTAREGEDVVDEMTDNISQSCDENENVQLEVDKVLADITKIVDSIRLIQEKTQLINDIVFQTKLLSFNASVEAARAGEHGKGFAVVAEEVGNLAAMSGKASIEIHEMIEDSVNQVEKIVGASSKNLKEVIESSTNKITSTKSSIDACKSLFLQISRKVNEINHNVQEVSKRADEKVIVIDEVNDRFIYLKEFSEQSSSMAHSVDVLTEKLEKDSSELEKVSKDLSQKFAA